MKLAIDWVYHWRYVPWAVTVLTGLMALIPVYFDAVAFAIRPVVVMTGTLESRTTDTALIRISGEKRRGIECRYLGIQAFGQRLVGPMVDLYITRTDMPSDGKTKPVGSYDIGLWAVRPVAGVTRVLVYVSHDCDGAEWATQVASVPI